MLQNQEGKSVPQVTFRCRQGDQWLDRTTAELFGDKRVILFALPGAFTPTCSSSHLPRYNELASQFKQAGIDGLYCLSVNDGFVMEAWQQDQHAENITFLPDGNGDFSEGVGMLVDKTALGFGKRSWRYSMVVNNGVIEKMFIEDELPGDPFQVSDADTMLAYVAPKASEEPSVTLVARAGCGHCARAKALLEEKGMSYQEIRLGRDINHKGLFGLSGRRTVPQVFIDGKHIGGADDLIGYLG